tara:strand:+ start:3458 stop:3733 length:276 start_codon:yes stop_codon:yes gene_type:complete
MDLGENPVLKQKVQKENDLKNFLVNYAGDMLGPKDDNVTVEMVIEAVATDFPEFLMAVAEENWVRGYHQALVDVEDGEKAFQEQLKNLEDE